MPVSDEWLSNFEIESHEVIASVGLEPGDRIPDVGGGTCLYRAAFPAAVGPAGHVYAVDISPRLTEFSERRIWDEKLGNVATVRSTPTSTTLQPDSVTHAFDYDAVRKENEAAGFRFVEDVPVAAFKENDPLHFCKPATE
jgi:predicted methyltransferase